MSDDPVDFRVPYSQRRPERFESKTKKLREKMAKEDPNYDPSLTFDEKPYWHREVVRGFAKQKDR